LDQSAYGAVRFDAYLIAKSPGNTTGFFVGFQGLEDARGKLVSDFPDHRLYVSLNFINEVLAYASEAIAFEPHGAPEGVVPNSGLV
jgi:hypothetical protein